MSYTKSSIIFCSTSIAMYDRRMIRITEAISEKGYKLKWISRQHSAAKESETKVNYLFIQCFFNSGILFYLEYNIRLFITLLGSSEECISSVDLDTLLAATVAARLKRKKLIFDAHEIFYEVPELTGKPIKKWIWKQVARWCIRHTDLRYTVNNSLKKHYEKHYNKNFHVIRNVPDVIPVKAEIRTNNKVLVYLGAVNKGRGIEIAIRSLQRLTEYSLVILGEGDEYDQMRNLAESLGVMDRVDFRGYTTPDNIFPILQECSIGLNVLVAESENYRLSLANKFFDYMHAGLPSINMSYPEYESILSKHQVGLMIDDYNLEDLVEAVRKLEDTMLYNKLAENCSVYKELYTWASEKEILAGVYDSI